MAKANKHLTEELYEMTIGKILVTDLETGLEMYSGSLKSMSVSKSASTTKIRAGEDNVQWMELIGDSEISIEVVDIQAKRDWLALKLGGTLEEQSVEIEAFPKNYKITDSSSSKVITLDHTPVSGQTITVYNKKTNTAIESSKVSLSEKTLTITDSGVNVGDVVYVGSYKHTVEVEAIKIPTASASRDVAITISNPVANAQQKVVYDKVYKFYRANMGTDFTDEATSEKSEGAVSTTFTVLKHTDYEDLGFLAYVPRG